MVGRICLRFMAFTGVRDGGVLRIMIDDVDFVSGKYLVRLKGGEIVNKGIPLNMIEELKELIGKLGKGRLFPTTAESLRRLMARGCKAVGVEKITPHGLRGHFGTTMANAGVQIVDLARQMNHKKVETTYKFYMRANEEREAEVLNLSHPVVSGSSDVKAKLELLRKSGFMESFLSDSRMRFKMETVDGKS